MALAYATTALEMLADKFPSDLHVKALNFAFPLPGVELNTFLSMTIRFYLCKSDEKKPIIVWCMVL